MPPPLSARLIDIADADRLMPLPTVIVVIPAPMGALHGIRGIPTPTLGSLRYGVVFAFGWLTAGWLTVNRGRKRFIRTHRGHEDAHNQRA